MALVTSWLRQNGYWVSASTRKPTAAGQQPLTHVFLNGGKASVPDEVLPQLLGLYAEVVSSDRNDLYMVERTPHNGKYRMFCDFDIPLKPGEDVDGNDRLREVLESAFAHIPTRLHGFCFTLCVRQAHGGKVGAHLIWPDVAVDDAAALELRNEWVASLLRFCSASDWEHIIDAAVYKKNGLRMPWSMKRGHDARSCYVPWRTLIGRTGGVDLVDEVKPDAFAGNASMTYTWLERSTIRSHVIGDGHVITASRSSGAARDTKKRMRLPSSAAAAGSDEDCVLLTYEQSESLRSLLPSPYASVEFSHMKKRGCAYIFPCESRHCLTAGREHTSNRVYFLAGADGGLDQCCFSSACDGRRTRVNEQRPAFLSPVCGNNNNKRQPACVTDSKQKKKKKTRTSVSVLPISAKAAVGRWISNHGAL